MAVEFTIPDGWTVEVPKHRGKAPIDYSAILAKLEKPGDQIILPEKGDGWTSRPRAQMEKVLETAESLNIPVAAKILLTAIGGNLYRLAILRVEAAKEY